MGADPDWTTLLQAPYIEYEAGTEPEYAYVPYIRRDENEGDKLSAEEEYHLMKKQVVDTQGFDIDFKKFRCIFNYKPVDFNHNDDFIEPEITKELMDRLSCESLKEHNDKNGTDYELVKVVKANYHDTAAPAVMYFITFEGKNPSSDDQPKTFQAKVCYYIFESPKCVSCILKPEKKAVHYLETAEKDEDPKKPRLTQEPSDALTQADETQALICH